LALNRHISQSPNSKFEAQSSCHQLLAVGPFSTFSSSSSYPLTSSFASFLLVVRRRR